MFLASAIREAGLAVKIFVGGAPITHEFAKEIGADAYSPDAGSAVDTAMISLGSSRLLWEDAALLPKSTVLYGNLPTKQFYSDELCSVAKVRQLSDTLLQRMRASGHPFILGSECDILSVPGSEQTIKRKVEEFLKKGGR